MKAIRLTAALLFFSSLAVILKAADGDDVTKSFKVNKGGTLKVYIMTGDITVDTWNKNEVNVSIANIDENQNNLLNISQSGNNVTVKFNGSGYYGNSNVKVSVPSEYNLNLQTSQGDVQLSNNLKGSVQIETRSGDITLASINGYLKALTNGGDITLNAVNGTADVTTYGGDITTGNVNGNLSLSTMGGDIEAQNITGKADISTRGGTINLLNVGKDLHAITNGGDITTGDVGGNADISTMGGSIHMKKVSGSAILKTNGGNIKLFGASGSTKARTFGGNLELYNINGSVDASTNSGDIYIELKPGGSSSSIASMNGGVKLFIDPSAKATINAVAYGVQYGESINDYIKSDFPMKRSETSQYSSSTKATITLNGGGSNINVRSDNDRIEIRKLKK
ncbi:MAG: hypothetical protein M1480_20875 [Bacteroidetes bacterium]|nr:hypothetical protein [Bacteroidota bacterium]